MKSLERLLSGQNPLILGPISEQASDHALAVFAEESGAGDHVPASLATDSVHHGLDIGLGFG
jgi:hypothetical protein